MIGDEINRIGVSGKNGGLGSAACKQSHKDRLPECILLAATCSCNARRKRTKAVLLMKLGFISRSILLFGGNVKTTCGSRQKAY